MKIRNLIVVLVLVINTCIIYGSQTEESYDLYIKTSSIGNYDFEIESHEVPSHEYLPIISKDYFPYSVYNIQSEVENTEPSAIYKAKTITKVDVVFAIGEFSQFNALQQYIKSFTSMLEKSSNSIDAMVEQVETTTIDSNSAGAAEIFNKWTNYPDQSGQWTFNATNNSMGSTQNVAWTGFWHNTAEALETTDIVIEYKSKEEIRVANMAPLAYPNINCHPDPMGWTFRMTYDGDYSYYAFCIYAYQGVAVLCRVNDTPSPNNATQGLVTGWTSTIPNMVGKTSGYVTQLAFVSVDYNPSIEHSSKIAVEGQHIQIWYDNKLIIDYTDNDTKALKSGGYGPFTYSMPNACFYDIVITTGSSSSLGEAISDVNWRDGSVRFVIHATDVIPEECLAGEDESYAYTIAKLLASNAYLINLGKDSNKAALDSILNGIKQADGTLKGTYFSNSPITVAMNKSANYIIEIAKNLSKPTDWVLINTEILWNTEYDDYEYDIPLNYGEHDGTEEQPQDTWDLTLQSTWGIPITYGYSDDKINAEKWRYRHDQYFFDNELGEANFNAVWIEDPVPIFDKTGKYRINYKRIDNPIYDMTDGYSLTHSFKDYRYWSTNYDKIESIQP